MAVEGRELDSARLPSPLVVALVALVVAGVGPLLAEDSVSFVLVANPSVEVESLSAKEVSDLFLKKVTRWEDGSAVEPVDLPSESPVRASFSEAVHDRQVSAIKSYWQRQIFSGRAVPPPEKATEGDVVAFVRSRRGAIGYVSATASIGDLRILRVTE